MTSATHCICFIALCACILQVGLCKNVGVLQRLRELNCGNLNTSVELVEMKSCNKTGNTVECEYVGLAVDYSPFISHDYSVYATLWFHVLPGERCLSLNRITAQKVPTIKAMQNVTCSPLNPQWLLFMLLGLKSFKWSVELDGKTPVGLLQDETRVLVMDPIDLLGYGQNGYDKDYQQNVRELLVDGLGSHNGFLDVGLYMQTEDTYFMQVYVLPLMATSTNLTSLRLAGDTNWGYVPPLIAWNPQLVRLELPDNNITGIDIENFKNATEIMYLNLADNKLSSLPEGVSLLSKLQTLDISGNPIQYNNYSSFSAVIKNLKQLRHLILARTPLEEMRSLFSSLGPPESGNSALQLSTLDVSRCGITSLDDSFTAKILVQQHLLTSINLSGNKLVTPIPSTLFINLPRLNSLNLSDTGLAQGPGLEFGMDRILDFLDLSHNELTKPENILRSGSVKYLNLSSNKIKDWEDPELFSRAGNASSWVEELNLSQNVLATVTQEMGTSLRYLHLVDLGANPIDCTDCHMPEFQAWLAKDNGTKITNLGRSIDITCEEPYDMLGIPVRKAVVDLAKCEDTSTTTTVIGVVCGLAVILLVSAALVIHYRHEVAYLSYLVKLKRRRRNLYGDGKFEYDAFVCYSRADRSWVMDEMVPTLENSSDKFRLCLHERDFILGSFITLNIVNSMQKSRFTVVVLSNGFVKSQWCQWEIEMANHKLFESGREFLILVELERLDQKQIPRHLRYLMDTRTYLEWPTSKTEAGPAWKRLRSALGVSLHNMELQAVRARAEQHSELQQT